MTIDWFNCFILILILNYEYILMKIENMFKRKKIGKKYNGISHITNELLSYIVSRRGSRKINDETFDSLKVKLCF